MTRRLPLAGLILVIFAVAAHAAPARPAPLRGGPTRWRPGELLVLRADPARVALGADGRLDASDAGLRGALARHGLSRYAALGQGRELLRLSSDKPDFDARAAARELAATGAFRAVAPNLLLDLYETIPNDLYFLYQWHLKSSANTDAQLTEAWDVWRGDTSTAIAIMDIGVDVSHPDLASQAWINRAEIPGNGVDDDGDGYVDDVKGWDFGDGDNDPSPTPTIDPASGIDIGFHGTFVAGIAAAATNNSTGIAGAAWKCRYMALKVGNAAGDIPLAAVAEAFQYVDMKHPAVLNMSFGTADTTARDFFQALVNDATAANVLCVAAAGNDGTDVPSWPAACNGVLAVAATDESNARASFSNYGGWVDVAAPGAGIWSTICQNYPIDPLSQLYYLLLFGWGGDPYMYGDGTSFASPLVAGIAGLVRSQNPSLTPAQVAAQIVATGDVVAYDQPIGPRVDAYRALTQPIALAVGPDTGAPGLAEAWPNPFAGSTTIAFGLSEAARVELAIFDVNGRNVRELVNAMLPAGRHVIRWDGRGADGRRLSSGVYFATLEKGGRQTVRKLVLTQ